ncbi:MAG TPA: HAD family hydrolase [Lachnospiraceae bacterium]|nr:HAD family hydrolase [Lachnospiraceae bacterium]
MNTIFDGIIFDVDGTIWDSTPVVAKAWNAALKDFGYGDHTVTADRLKGLFGLPMSDIIKDILPYAALKEREAFLPVCSKYEFEALENEGGIVYEGLKDTLSELVGEGIPLFIVSNCQSGYIELVYRKTGFGIYFKDQLCPGDTGRLKAANIGLICENHALKSPVYVGDTVMDMNACREAGVPFIHAAYGFGRAEGADMVIDSPVELLKRVKGE